jgi:hypothetical protein
VKFRGFSKHRLPRFIKAKEHGEPYRAKSCLLEKCRALSKKKPSHVNEMIPEKLDSFATLPTVYAASAARRRILIDGINEPIDHALGAAAAAAGHVLSEALVV